MGNPDAPVKLVEYGSLTCPHCADFAAAGDASRWSRNYVRSGRVSFEYRNFVLNGIDVAATLLARCAAPALSSRWPTALSRPRASGWAGSRGLTEAQKDAAERASGRPSGWRGLRRVRAA